jgi:Zn-dependent metalloprotease
MRVALIGMVLLASTACSTAEPLSSIPQSVSSQEQPGEQNTSARGKMTQPPHTKIDYRSNGTPSLVKGENLSVSLGEIPDFQSALKNNDYEQMTYLFLDYYKTFFKLAAPLNNLNVESIQSDALGSTHVRLQQMLNQIPVWEKTIRIHFNDRNALYMFQGDYLPSAVLENVETTAELTSSDASKIALESVSGAPGQWRVQNGSTMVYVAESQEPRLAYGLTLAKGLAQRYQYIIDAVDGRILEKTSLIRY